MQSLPIIAAVFLAAAAIIAVLFWRLKPQTTDTTASDKRLAEEMERGRVLQAKLDAGEAALREALASAAAAKATTEAANNRVAAAETRAARLQTDFGALQSKHNEVEPLVAAATEQKKAAEEARAELARRLAGLTDERLILQADAKAFLERATKAEKDAATAKTETDAARDRVEMSDARLTEATNSLALLHTEVSTLKSRLSEATAQREAAEEAKAELENRWADLTQRHQSLQTEFNVATGKASAAVTDAENRRIQIDGMSRTIEALETNLTDEKAKLNQALARQQSTEDAARHFETISQSVLKETMLEAKLGLEELAKTLQKSSGDQLELHAGKVAQTLQPLQAKLLAYDDAMKRMEQESQKTYGGLTQQITELRNAEIALNEQAKALTSALSASPKVKGMYGEMILKQLVEFVGMQEKCHFETQASRETEEGRKIPDLVVSLPGGQKVLVDAKAVMDACVEAQKAQNETHKAIHLKKHCENVRSRILDLSSKNYFVDHQDAVEAVVLFLPAENLYATAMENDPGLTEYAMGKNIILCGPNSLMLLLKVSNQLWRRAAVEKEVKDIRDCGEKIYKAACDFVEKFAGIGKKIQSLESEYNSAVGTFEGRLLPAGKRMSAFESVSGSKELGEIEPVKDNVREFKHATVQLASGSPQLLDLLAGEESVEFTFAAGGN